MRITWELRRFKAAHHSCFFFNVTHIIISICDVNDFFKLTILVITFFSDTNDIFDMEYQSLSFGLDSLTSQIPKFILPI